MFVVVVVVTISLTLTVFSIIIIFIIISGPFQRPRHQLCPAEEAQRRHALMNELYYVRLVVDSQAISRTPPRPLNAAFTINFREGFRVNVARAPTALALQLWQASSTLQRDLQLGGKTEMVFAARDEGQ